MPDTFNMSDVMISYSRRNKAFAQRLENSLRRTGREIWVDWEDINPAVDWWQEIAAGIEAADTFVCIITPDFVASEVCAREVQHAVDHNKRLIPVVHIDLSKEDMELLHPDLKRHNWIMFRDGVDDLNVAFRTLLQTIETDMDHLRSHTRFLVRAREWSAKGKRNSFVLRGDELREAENWLKSGINKSPLPTELHQEYITTSRQVTIRQRRLFALVGTLALLVVMGFGVSTMLANRASDEAQQTREVAETNVAQEATNVRLALNTAEVAGTEAEIERDNAEEQAANAESQRLTAEAQATTANNNAQTAVANGELAESNATEANNQRLAALDARGTAEAEAQNALAQANIALTERANALRSAQEAADSQATAVAGATSEAIARGDADAGATEAQEARGTAEAESTAAENERRRAEAESSLSNVRALASSALAQLNVNRPQALQEAIDTSNAYLRLSIPASFPDLQAEYAEVGVEVNTMLRQVLENDVGLRQVVEFQTRDLTGLAYTSRPEGDLLIGISPMTFVIMDPITGNLYHRSDIPTMTCMNADAPRSIIESDRFGYVSVSGNQVIAQIQHFDGSSNELMQLSVDLSDGLDSISFNCDRLLTYNDRLYLLSTAISNDGTLAARSPCITGVGGYMNCSGTIEIYELDDPQNDPPIFPNDFAETPLLTFEGHGDRIVSLVFSDDDRQLFSASVDGTTRFWDIPRTNIGVSRPSSSLDNASCFDLEPELYLLAISPDGSRKAFYYNLQTSSSTRSVILIQEDSNPNDCRRHFEFASVRSMLFNADGSRLIVNYSCDTLCLSELNTITGEVIQEYTPADSFVCEFCRAENLQLSTTQNLLSFTIVNSANRGIAFGALELGGAGPIRTTMIETVQHNQRVWLTSTDGSIQVIGNREGNLRISRADGSIASYVTAIAHSAEITSVALSNPPRWMVSGSADGSFALWDIESLSREPIARLRHVEDIDLVDISDDGRIIIVASDNGTISVWERPIVNGVTAPVRVQVIRLYERGALQRQFSQLAISADGRYIITGTWRESDAQIFEISSIRELTDELCETAYAPELEVGDRPTIRDDRCDTFNTETIEFVEASSVVPDETVGQGGGFETSYETLALTESLNLGFTGSRFDVSFLAGSFTGSVQINVDGTFNRILQPSFVDASQEIATVSITGLENAAHTVELLPLGETVFDMTDVAIDGNSVFGSLLEQSTGVSVAATISPEVTAEATQEPVIASDDAVEVTVEAEVTSETEPSEVVVVEVTAEVTVAVEITEEPISEDAPIAKVTESAIEPEETETVADESVPADAAAEETAPVESVPLGERDSFATPTPALVVNPTPAPIVGVQADGLTAIGDGGWQFGAIEDGALSSDSWSIGEPTDFTRTHLTLSEGVVVDSETMIFEFDSLLLSNGENDSLGFIEIQTSDATWAPIFPIDPSESVVPITFEIGQFVTVGEEIEMRFIWYQVNEGDSWAIQNLRFGDTAITPESTDTVDTEVTAEVTAAVSEPLATSAPTETSEPEPETEETQSVDG